MSPALRRLVWILALVGLAASLTSLYVHVQLLVQPGYVSFCDVNQTVNCQDAYLSRYGTVRGVPVALFGVAWFGLVVVMAFLEATGPESLRQSMPTYLLGATTVALGVVLYMAYAAFVVLEAVCLLCVTTYVAVIGLFILSALARAKAPTTGWPGRVFTDLRALIAHPPLLAVAGVFVIGAASAIAFFPDEGSLRSLGARQDAGQAATAEQRSEFERYWEAQPRVTVPVPSGGAAIVIVKFADLQCPPCAALYFGLRPVLAKYHARHPGAVRLISKDWPWQPECNVHVPRPMHAAACDASVAVRLAQERDKGDALEEHLYSHQAAMSPATVREAVQAIAGVNDFDLQYPRLIASVKADIALGRLLGVRSTPTLFINGVKLESPTALAVDLAIAYELRRAGVTK